MKKGILLIISMIILLVGCGNNESNIQKDNVIEEQINEVQVKAEYARQKAFVQGVAIVD